MNARTHEEHEQMLRHRSFLAVVAALLLLAISAPIWLIYNANSSTAAFADAEVLDNNRLGAARLDLEIGDSSAIFEATNLAPGDVVSGQLELRNTGTLPLLYEVSGYSDGDPLADWLLFELWLSHNTCSVDDTAERLAQNLTFGPSIGSFDDGAVDGRAVVAQGGLSVGEHRTMCIGARLALEAPNDAQGRRTQIDIVIDAVHNIEADQGDQAGQSDQGGLSQ